jgi:L-amino acid N-acyltransferase YncA
VRPARDGDRAALIELHRALHVTLRGELVPATLAPLHAYRDFDRLLAEDLAFMLGRSDHQVLVATEAGQVVGYASGRMLEEPRRVLTPKGVVGDWYVRPEVRGRGLGRMLMDNLLAWFRTKGCRVVESSTLPGNHRARRLHEHLGFDEVEVRYRARL